MTHRIMLILMLVWGAVYWSLQPTCGPTEARVRGVFMTVCVAGH